MGHPTSNRRSKPLDNLGSWRVAFESVGPLPGSVQVERRIGGRLDVGYGVVQQCCRLQQSFLDAEHHLSAASPLLSSCPSGSRHLGYSTCTSSHQKYPSRRESKPLCRQRSSRRAQARKSRTTRYLIVHYNTQIDLMAVIDELLLDLWHEERQYFPQPRPSRPPCTCSHVA